MAILNALQGGTSVSNNGSVSSGQSAANSWQQSASQTDAASARAFSAEQATLAYKRQKELMQMEMDYNTREAEKQRQWELDNANTIYTRSVQNMKEAGINPILAANMGLSGASVGSGATANISGASAPMAQSFMDTSSASAGGSQSYGENHGSSWGSSYGENGLATGLQLLGEAISGALGTIKSAQTIDIALTGLDKLFPKGYDSTTYGKGENGKKHSLLESPGDRIIDGISNKLGITKMIDHITQKSKKQNNTSKGHQK